MFISKLLHVDIDKQIEALIFDCDGTLADNMHLHYQAWSQALAEHGIKLDKIRFYQLAGIPGDQLVHLFADEQNINIDAQKAIARKIEIFTHLLPQTRPIEPVIDIVKAYHPQLPMAVATGGKRFLVEKTLDILHIRSCFQTIVTAAEVKNPKPAPDTFIKAARRLGVNPETCIVFEDGDLGIQGAQAAGMFAIDIRPLLSASTVTTKKSNPEI